MHGHGGASVGNDGASVVNYSVSKGNDGASVVNYSVSECNDVLL